MLPMAMEWIALRGLFAPPLEAVLRRVSDVGLNSAALVVFDLDDTLLSTKNRHLRILMEFAAGTAAADGATACRLAGVRPAQVRYSIADTARQAGVSDPAALARLSEFWMQRFFRNEYLLEDSPVAGAPEFVRAVLCARGRVVYLTGRDEAMRAGTLAALGKWDFPMPEREPWWGRVRLLMKPAFEINDLAFKREAFEGIAAMGEVVAGFENEPSYLNAMLERFPAMAAVLLETQHSGQAAEPHAAVHRVPHFLLSSEERQS